jgi:hypothetical protein
MYNKYKNNLVMKIILKENTQKELKRLNLLYGEENSLEYDNWEKMSELEVLITDAGMYADGAYEQNKFDDLNEWCKSVGPMEYNQTYLNTHPNAVRSKINKMLSKNIIEIV